MYEIEERKAANARACQKGQIEPNEKRIDRAEIDRAKKH